MIDLQDLMPAIALCVFGFISLNNPEMWEKLAPKGYTQPSEKIALMMGFGCFGLAAATFLMVLGDTFNKTWLFILGLAGVPLTIFIVYIFESRDGKK